MVWINLEGLSVELDGQIVVTALPCCVSLGMERLSLSLQFRIERNLTGDYNLVWQGKVVHLSIVGDFV